MALWTVRYDFRAPAFATARRDLVSAALDQCAWADERGCSSILFPEHHGTVDGYLPSPSVMAGAAAARTKSTQILVIQTPLRDPFTIAEDLAEVDHISGGRTELLLAAGYVPEEFAMYGEDHADRGGLLVEKARAVTSLLEGRHVEYRGRRGQISPRPYQQPRPRIRFGGATRAAARRAAEHADAFMPIVPDPALIELYENECARLGRQPRSYPFPRGGLNVLVVRDPDRAWRELAPHILHDMNAYGTWKSATPQASPYFTTADVEEARNSGIYSIVTPQQCVELVRNVPEPSSVLLHPLLGGVDPQVGWECLQLFVDEVLPALEPHPT
ncbi:LLM class flavin-dependent oxidoreductase [Lipingzhangella sp. LS1_29]|uniref:LLM class flavin-dependent oxidoreductase n=1 Tax=Lipingzhangella rawalii TaxID=2055835 RepID=A0ABU2HA55_9ACTN|nr:LLM class flavin-dependent oxidoreductase [Lipingzhangella rawalii]MDS1272204.1 LLM class flavin-dependent oxidoreductase [Lipingzhangella rawalii]